MTTTTGGAHTAGTDDDGDDRECSFKREFKEGNVSLQETTWQDKELSSKQGSPTRHDKTPEKHVDIERYLRMKECEINLQSSGNCDDILITFSVFHTICHILFFVS